MAQLSDDCFAFGGRLMPLAEALALLASRVTPVTGEESVPLAAAAGRVLAHDLVAAQDVPPHDNSAVDGYAVAHRDLAASGETVLPVGGRAAAGHPLGRPARPSEAIRVFTGAPMPEGTDTVLMQEDCRERDGRVTLPAGLKPGANRRFAGEDVKAGSVALAAGTRLRPQEVGLAAALGRREIPVRRRLRVALLSSGDEVREPGEAASPGSIYDANRFVLAALLGGLGCAVTDVGIVRDSPDALAATLASAAAGHDLVVGSGGMSAGEEDHMKRAVEAQGQLHFWRLAIKPGRPVALGQIGRVPFLGLPGNPVAVMVTFLVLGRPLVLLLAGATPAPPRRFPVASAFAWRKKADRREFLRARLDETPAGLLVHKYPRDGAGILSSMTQSEGLVELAEGTSRIEPGAIVPFIPFSELLV